MLPKIRLKYLFFVSLGFFATQAWALDWYEHPGIAALFDRAGVHGTFVLYDVADDNFIGHDRRRAETRYLPASTFKIMNSLIGLTVGAVKDVDDPIPFGGLPQPIKAWERDMGLRDAIRISNVPVYQELARRIGIDRMREQVSRIGFGNGDIGTVVDDFWLRGPLEISGIEQARFLARLARDELPLPTDTQRVVREIVEFERGEDWTLYAKTGWATAVSPGIGWWFGWVVKESRVYSFALNIDMPDRALSAQRIELGKASLRLLGVL